MNHDQLSTLCNTFELGTPLNTPKRVHGGLLHMMWRINTDEASYAVKQLSPDIDLTNEAIVKNYNLTEDVAARFTHLGIPAISALKQDGKYLVLIDNTGYLIYPWVDAQALHCDTVSEIHAITIAKTLAKMHNIKMDMPEFAAPEFDTHTNETLLELIQKANRCHCPFAEQLESLQDHLIAINIAFQNTLPQLKQHTIVSHGDLDQKNVLWDANGNPILIDWECARKLNPTHEIVNAGLDWSGITTHFDKALFIKMMQAYTAAGGILDITLMEAAFNAVLGNWINWMVYNINRACLEQECEQKTLGIEQVNQVLKTITTLINIIPGLMGSITTKQGD
jgi:Ser/Thr protein kinase RdoA (MazF antagonist)